MHATWSAGMQTKTCTAMCNLVKVLLGPLNATQHIIAAKPQGLHRVRSPKPHRKICHSKCFQASTITTWGPTGPCESIHIVHVLRLFAPCQNGADNCLRVSSGSAVRGINPLGAVNCTALTCCVCSHTGTKPGAIGGFG